MSSSLAESMAQAASYEIAGKREEALALLCEARDAGHPSPKLYAALGHLHFELRRFEEASRAYEDSLQLDGSDSTTYYNRAVCLEKLEA
jgi:Flp pilus assembly protein TadD